MILKIYKYGSQILRNKCQFIKSISSDTKQLIDDMTDTMYKDDGIGLSANQVGFDLSLAIIGKHALESENDLIIINPKIIEYSDEKTFEEEGCLSIPDIREKVNRSKEIVLEYQDLNLKTITKKFVDLPARVIQHETDHLNGIFFTDRLSFVKKKLLNKKLNQIAKS